MRRTVCWTRDTQIHNVERPYRVFPRVATVTETARYKVSRLEASDHGGEVDGHVVVADPLQDQPGLAEAVDTHDATGVVSGRDCERQPVLTDQQSRMEPDRAELPDRVDKATWLAERRSRRGPAPTSISPDWMAK